MGQLFFDLENWQWVMTQPLILGQSSRAQLGPLCVHLRCSCLTGGTRSAKELYGW